MNLTRNWINGFSAENLLEILLGIGLVTVSCIVFYYNSKNIQVRLAHKGTSPHDYVSEKLHPENFQRNWRAVAGITNYDKSLPMRVYYYLAKYWGIGPTTTIYPYMFVQTLLFFLSVAFLAQTLFQNKVVAFVSVVVMSLSNLAGLNLSRFGAGYSSLLSFPLFYGYANAFRFFALAFFLRNKYVLCFVSLALSMYSHLNMGLFALAFVGAYVLYKPGLLWDKCFVRGIFVFFVLVIPHIFSVLSSSTLSSGGIDPAEWVKSTKIFSLHWYPFTMKLFTKNAHREFFPFLVLCFSFFVSLRYHDIKDERTTKIIVGSIACLMMSSIGIIISEIYPIPLLIKISLQRSTGLITFLGVLFLIYYLVRKMNADNIFIVFLATYSLVVSVCSKPGIAVLPIFLLLYSDIREGYFGPLRIGSSNINISLSSYYLAAVLLLLFTLNSVFKHEQSIANGILTPLKYFNPFYRFDFLLRGGSFKLSPIFAYLVVGSALITAATIFISRSKSNKALRILFGSIFFALCVSTVWYLSRDHYLAWHSRYHDRASSYLDVQLWAKNNTPHDALFMPDPTHYYGWRDFSERSSFGNLREWGYCVIAYNPDYKLYQEGKKRMREFGLDIKGITEEDLKQSKTFIYGEKLSRDVRRTFYDMKAEQLTTLSLKYNIDYVIMNKRYHKNRFEAFKVAYENEYYVVYRV